ncbi:hypothetical protein DFP72DRAFT_1067780 [Ephemerocybe angulata]|uniref:Uncharacterized protein n=1 Tax=Ephemerocybe angulata TaxID=980116 RepID=A0A8H6HYD7_9AGAR|nr:hypothetical protein DFP72DRAFT_1067780 [Tulosesus angulatus]
MSNSDSGSSDSDNPFSEYDHNDAVRFQELHRVLDDDELVELVMEWARGTWGVTEETLFYLRGMPKGVPYPRVLLASPVEVRTGAAEFLRCLIARRSGHSKHVGPKLEGIFASSQLDGSQKMSTCYFLRHHNPYSLQPKGPAWNQETGLIDRFRWYWTPVATDCVFEDLLSDLCVSDFYRRGRLVSDEMYQMYPGRDTSFSKKRKCPGGVPERDLHVRDVEGSTLGAGSGQVQVDVQGSSPPHSVTPSKITYLVLPSQPEIASISVTNHSSVYENIKIPKSRCEKFTSTGNSSVWTIFVDAQKNSYATPGTKI